MHYGLSRERVEVIPIGADPDRVVPMGRSSRFRAQSGLGGFVILHAGNLGRSQNFDTLLDAARLLQESRPEMTFVFVGDGAQKEHIRQRVAREGMTNVRIYPFVPQEEFSDMLASADVSLVTLEPGAEGLGVPSKFYNILASGRPCVAIVAPDSEVARVLVEADCGVRVNPGEPANLAEVLVRLCDAPQETARMGENARRVLIERYTTQHVTQQFYETFVAAAHPYPLPPSEPRIRPATSTNGVHPPAVEQSGLP
jgi:glycosyltransferase involved in cell wall biosynthesis